MQNRRTGCCAGFLGICLAGFVILAAIGFVVTLTTTDKGPSEPATSIPTPPPPKTPDELRNERIERQFSLWDGSHPGLTKVIKASMNDPQSYEHVKTVYWDMGSNLVVRTIFRGKNAFGGVVENWVKAKVDLDGNVIQIIEQGR